MSIFIALKIFNKLEPINPTPPVINSYDYNLIEYF